MSSAERTNDNAMKSTSFAMPHWMSLTSFSVIDGRLTRTPGRLTWRLLPSVPPSTTRHVRRGAVFFEDVEVDQAVVDRDSVADVDRRHEIVVVDLNGAVFDVDFAAYRQRHDVAGLQHHRLRHDRRCGSPAPAYRAGSQPDSAPCDSACGSSRRSSRRSRDRRATCSDARRSCRLAASCSSIS